ncbi:hypothetical protein IMSAGC007_03600 [Lachnospiraceae bacterium]|uniref:hypothetical protein n=1 Tax=Candidatus Merdisoma sp. JLR.KK011 TaxID=3114299 RepID=UPI0014347C11|nr:hypothetical protein IMSAGC007_03600 [Lachnospiraceae bacterium]
MIRLFTSTNYFKPEEIIIDNESFFDNIDIDALSQKSIDVMEQIDKAKLLDLNTGKIETPFGIAGVTDLSTGCKTVINTIYIYENPNAFPTVKAINATECGSNALEVLFDVLESNNINLSIVLEHEDDLYKCKEREYLVNNSHRINQLAFYWACADRRD